MTGRILYLMHVDWRWIKQRPHFLAEALASLGWDVTVGFVPTWRRRRLPQNDASVRRRPLPLIPRWTSPRARAWNTLLGGSAVTRLIDEVQPDAVWVTHAGLLSSINDSTLPLVYDVMDLNPDFHHSLNAADTALQQELHAWSRAAILYTSSNQIFRQIAEYSPSQSGKAQYLPNAYDDRMTWTAYPRQPDSQYRLTYFGTISDWLDVKLLQDTLHYLPDVEILLAGPTDVALPKHSRLKTIGPVPHDHLPGLAAKTDCFLLPFSVTPLVEGVDPVKFYEYLAMRRPILSCYYPELDRFRGLVTFYEDTEDFIRLVRSRPPLPERTSVAAFLSNNTWRRRAEAIHRDLLDIV